MELRGHPELGPTDALLVVDVQRDFCPGGALAVAEGDQVVGVLNVWIEEAVTSGALVVASRDWHPPDHVSFASRGGPWPPHCVQGTTGAELHPDLRLPAGTVLVSKGQEKDRDAYSAFDGTDLAGLLERNGIRRLFVGGLAREVCVQASVLDALRAGLETHVLVDATRAVDEHASTGSLLEMEAEGALLEFAPQIARH